MRKQLLGTLLCISGLASAVAAQQTWIVDPSGTGNFTSLALAIATASAGDTLLLRGGGQYTTVVGIDKALTLIGEPPGRPLLNSIYIVSGVNGPVHLVGFDVRAVFTYSPTSFEDLTMSRFAIWDTVAAFHGCTLGGHLDLYGGSNIGDVGWVSQSDALFVDCSLHGGAGYTIQTLVCTTVPPAPAVYANGSDVTLSGCTLRGGDGASFIPCPGVTAPAGTALAVSGTGIARLTHCSLTGGVDGNNIRIPSVYPSNFRFDPSTTFNPANTSGIVTFLPGISGQGAGPGGTMTCTIESNPGLGAALVASLGFTGPATLPEGIAWIDPAAYVVLRIGFTDAVGQLGATVVLPAWAPRGLPLTFQGAVAPMSGPLTAGAPVVLHVL